MSKRDDAMALLDKYVPNGIEIQSKRDAEKFESLTGTSHEALVADWKRGGIMSACNGFVSWYAGQLGIKGIASWFKLEESMRNIGQGTHGRLPMENRVRNRAIFFIIRRMVRNCTSMCA
jgi:hypothetical protein